MEGLVMTEDNMNSIFEQINHLKKPVVEIKEVAPKKDELREVLNSVSEEIKRVLDENNFTQEDLCRITNMSQKIAAATHTRLVISFESMEGEE